MGGAPTPAAAESVRAMEGAMLKANLWKSVPKVELDQRARDGRLQLEQIERLLVIPRAAVMRSRLRRLLFLLSVRLYGGEPFRGR